MHLPKVVGVNPVVQKPGLPMSPPKVRPLAQPAEKRKKREVVREPRDVDRYSPSESPPRNIISKKSLREVGSFGKKKPKHPTGDSPPNECRFFLPLLHD